ncbi:MAG: MFS transporter [Ruminococcus sp.]|nr:MFS transporter [Candidatus Copronaster equi]
MNPLKEKFNKIKNNPDFTLKEQLGYASGTFGNAMAQDSVNTYAEQYMFDYMGLPNKNILLLKSVTKGINIISAPIIGALIDGGKPGENKTLKFMLGASIPMTIASILLFVSPPGSMMVRFIWTFMLFLLFNIADTFYDVSIMTLSTRMSTNPKARKNFYTVAEFASTLGSMLPGWILPFIIDMQKGNFNYEKMAFFFVALTFGLLGFIAMIVPKFTLTEKIIIKQQVENKTSINFKLIFVNRPLIVLCLSQIVDSVRQVCYNALPFFYKQTLKNYKMKSIVEACSGGLSYTGLASVPFVGKKLSSRDMISFGYFWTGICYIILLIFGYKHLWLVGLLIAIAGFPNAAMSAARKILLADSADYMEWKTYKKYGTPIRNESMIFSFNTMTSRIAGLWKDLIINFGLGIIGYKSAQIINGQTVEAVQSAATLKGIFFLVVIPGIVGNILPGIIMRFDNFSGKKKEAILDELQYIRKLEKEIDEEVEKIGVK